MLGCYNQMNVPSFWVNPRKYKINQNGMPELPTGEPTGPAPVGKTPVMPERVVVVPPTIESDLYLPGFLRTQIGKNMRVEFLIGSTGPLVDRIGTLVDVGISYILLRPIESNDTLMCDIYSIKFVSIYE